MRTTFQALLILTAVIITLYANNYIGPNVSTSQTYLCQYANIECQCGLTQIGCEVLCSIGTMRKNITIIGGCDTFEMMVLIAFTVK